MEQHQINRSTTTLASLRVSLRKSVLTFINQHAGVFETLSRTQAPFGGSLLAGNR
ncbi:hypothetical protein [Spirosoma pollinicola]|uniref:hypothetical protein n=1 Tax=Spirosoma pollinicola TaxID=2057025 RepID=UPI0012FD2700|nr:hypothetical protein [Spirosoma pollinicola]